MLGFITVPNATSTFADIGVWSGGMFENLLPVAMMVMGLTIGGILVLFIMSKAIEAIKYMISSRTSRGSGANAVAYEQDTHTKFLRIK